MNKKKLPCAAFFLSGINAIFYCYAKNTPSYLEQYSQQRGIDNESDNNIRQAIEDGAEGFLDKPVTLNSLVTLLHRLGFE